MNFSEKIKEFSTRVIKLRENINTEEATKTSIVLPFFQLLGYDIFNPMEFVPEYTADVGTKKGEKVDYAIIIDGEPLILVETKPVNTELSTKHMNQLLRYFTVTKAKFAILTNGVTYKFYSDLEERNKMDSIPFLEFDLLDIKNDVIEELKNFQKDNFDMDNILKNASDLKYTSTVKKIISEQFLNPSDQFVRALISKNVYSGVKTQAVLDKFRTIIQKAFSEYLNELITERLNTAIGSSVSAPPTHQEKTELTLTIEEIETLDYIKNMINAEENIVYKKTSSYACMQIGENSRKWICRMFTRKSENLFTLHKFSGTNYECEYLFNSPEQLDVIEDIIKDVYEKCRCT